MRTLQITDEHGLKRRCFSKKIVTKNLGWMEEVGICEWMRPQSLTTLERSLVNDWRVWGGVASLSITSTPTVQTTLQTDDASRSRMLSENNDKNTRRNIESRCKYERWCWVANHGAEKGWERRKKNKMNITKTPTKKPSIWSRKLDVTIEDFRVTNEGRVTREGPTTCCWQAKRIINASGEGDQARTDVTRKRASKWRHRKNERY